MLCVTGSAIALRGAGDVLCVAPPPENRRPPSELALRRRMDSPPNAFVPKAASLPDTESDARLNSEVCRAWGVRR